MGKDKEKTQKKTSRFWRIIPKSLAILSALVMLHSPVTAAAKSIPSKAAVQDVTYGPVIDTDLVVDKYSVQGNKGFLERTLQTSDIEVCSRPGVSCTLDAPTHYAEIQCHGEALNGGWSHVFKNGSGSGASTLAEPPRCFNALTYCYNAGTPDEICFTIDANSGGGGDDERPQSAVEYTVAGGTSQCDVGSSSNNKEYCIWEYGSTSTTPHEKGSGGTLKTSTPNTIGITGDTGDDMFKISPTSHGFFEYADIPSSVSARLKYIRRDGGTVSKDLMIPSGPIGTFEDYRNFIKNPPADVDVLGACHPVTARISCPFNPEDGVCGTAGEIASAGTYASLDDIPAAAFCASGNPENISESGGTITWNCRGTSPRTSECRHEIRAVAECGERENRVYSTLDGLLDGGNEPGELCAHGSRLKGSVTGSDGNWTWTCTPVIEVENSEDAICISRNSCDISHSRNMVVVQDLSASFTDDMENIVNTFNLLLNHQFMSQWRIGLASTKGQDGTPEVYKKELDWTSVQTGKDAILDTIADYLDVVALPGSEDPIYAVYRALQDFGPGMPSDQGGTIVMITDETDDNRESYMPQIKTLLSNYNMKLLILHTEPVVRHHWNGSAWVPTNVFNYYQNLLDINNMNEMARTEIITPDSSNLSSAILSGLVSLSCSGEPIIGMCSNVVNAPEGQYSSFADLTNEQLCASGDVIEESKVNSDNRLSWVCRGYNGGDNSHECVYMKERPRAGVCGVAVQAPAGTYTSFGAIPADDLCGPGTAQLITENAANIIWRCNGIHGGANSPECVISKNYNATCGAARNITFNSLEDLQSDGRLCGANSTLEGSITDTATGWSWTCRPNTGLGNNANCSTTKTACPDGTILPQGVVPNDQTCPPTPECFMFVSGMFSGHENTDNYGRWTAVGDTEPRHVGGPAPLQIVSSFVGIGEYPASSPHTGYTGTTDYRSPNGYSVEEYPFLHADSFTFDSIALGSNTKVTIYSERNFQGTVITEIKGPALVNNVHLKTPLHDSYDWQNATLPAPYNDVIPPSARVWSTENMQPWGRGTSVKVICEPPPPACGDMSKENGDYYFAHQQVPDDKFCASGVAVSKANRRPQIEWKCQNPSDVTQQVDCSYDTPTVGVCGGFDLDATMEVCSAEWIAELEQMGLYASPGTLCANPEDTDPAVLESISRNPTNTDQYCNVGSLYNNAPNYGHSTQVLSNGVVHNIRMAQWVCHEPGVYGGDGRPYGWTCAFDTAPFLAKCKYKNSYNNFNTSNAECETGSVQNARSTSTSLDWECHSTAPGVTFHTNCGYNSSANVDPSTVGICNQSLTIYQSEIPSLTPTSKPWCAQGTVGNFSTSATRIDYECIGSNPAYKSTCWYSF